MLLDLDDCAAVDPALSGAKAARLAQARRRGLPVPPGVVVPVAASGAAVDAAVAALERGSGAARLAALRSPPDPALLADLADRVAGVAGPLVVRSSSPLEDATVWSGAFSSLLDVGREDLGTALRSCWASAFAVDPLARASSVGVPPAHLGMAVLVQPQVACDAGGLARVADDGVVTVSAVAGSPAPLLTGWERGALTRVGADGAVEGDGGVLSRATAAAVARVAGRAISDLGCDVIEWALAGGDVVLLQCRASAVDAPQDAVPSVTLPDGVDHPMALRLARLAVRHPGPLAERLVLSWACAVDPSSTLEAPAPHVPADRRAAELRARELAAHAWGLAPGDAIDQARQTLAQARGPTPRPALQRLAALREVPAHEAGEAFALAAAAGAAGGAPPPVARDVWEPFVFAAVRAHGTRIDGVGAADGIGAGVLAAVTNPHAAEVTERRPVLAAPWPLPGLAPLLWGAAGLVTGAGSPAAHLLEVAQSLRVPAVVGCDLDPCLGGDPTARRIAAVDGAAGAVHVIDG